MLLRFTKTLLDNLETKNSAAFHIEKFEVVRDFMTSNR